MNSFQRTRWSPASTMSQSIYLSKAASLFLARLGFTLGVFQVDCLAQAHLHRDLRLFRSALLGIRSPRVQTSAPSFSGLIRCSSLDLQTKTF